MIRRLLTEELRNRLEACLRRHRRRGRSLPRLLCKQCGVRPWNRGPLMLCDECMEASW